MSQIARIKKMEQQMEPARRRPRTDGKAAYALPAHCRRTNTTMIESHPFEPFMPEGARLLMLGTFPPAEKRWSMPFYYPNFTNDMWRIVGLCFFGDKQHFVADDGRHYRLEELKSFLSRQGIALYDTCTRIIRTKNTASDKDLQVVEQTDVAALLRRDCHGRSAGHVALCSPVRCRRTEGGGVRRLLFRGSADAPLPYAQFVEGLSSVCREEGRVLSSGVLGLSILSSSSEHRASVQATSTEIQCER